ncbi:MAG: hypothetical protein ACRD0G_12100 [Acidimicrobiales bacterium]
MTKQTPLAAATLLILGAGLLSPTAARTDDRDLRLGPAVGSDAVPALLDDLGLVPGCDPTDPAACLLPFPNDRFTVADPTTDTGRRVNLPRLGMPANVAGLPIRPDEWNRNDGFSPGSMMLTLVPGLDLAATWGVEAQLTDLARSLDADAPIVLLDADTGERHPFWSELDSHPDTAAAQRLLIIRPATNLLEGHRYVVALRNLRRGDGSTIPAGPTFAAYRDGTQHEPRLGRPFADLEAAGVGRDDLLLAWDFTVASERNLSERMLRIRDDAFTQLGDTDLADGNIAGASPRFTIGEVTDLDDSNASRRIEGTVRVPNYLTPQVATEVVVPPEVTELVDGLGLDNPVTDLLGDRLPLSVPGSRFNTLGSQDGLPVQNPLQPYVDVPFTCLLPRSALDTPAQPMLYGHGLLGRRDQIGGGTSEARRRGFAGCAMDWWGMSFADLPNVATVLLDVSNFPSFADRIQQGYLNDLYLARAFAHPDGFVTHPAFRNPTGQPMISTGEAFYRGDSQGGIMGGALVALSPDIRRGVLGVPAMNFSTLLNRSVDWEGAYGELLYLTYTDPVDRQLIFALIQMLWDRAEPNGYAHHLTDDPLPNTPTHQVLLEVAFADHQVANVATEVEGRTISAALRTPVLPDGLHWSVDPTFGFATVPGGTDAPGSFIVYWYSVDRGNVTPPNANIPSRSGIDPHSDPRTDAAAADMEAHFLRTGTLLDTCGGPCITTPESRAR